MIGPNYDRNHQRKEANSLAGSLIALLANEGDDCAQLRLGYTAQVSFNVWDEDHVKVLPSLILLDKGTAEKAVIFLVQRLTGTLSHGSSYAFGPPEGPYSLFYVA